MYSVDSFPQISTPICVYAFIQYDRISDLFLVFPQTGFLFHWCCYLCQGGYVFNSVCLSFCLSVREIAQKRTGWFSWNLVEGWTTGQGKTHYISDQIHIKGWIQELFFTFFEIVRYILPYWPWQRSVLSECPSSYFIGIESDRRLWGI